MLAKKNSESEDHMWQIRMRMLTKRKKNLQIAQTIDKVIHQYYVVERGLPVPLWKSNKDPQWWIDYLASLKDDSRTLS
tara:strand:- start:141 stop:374 length:234 start_codon:yes stop_codon:yes gene_type:complete